MVAARGEMGVATLTGCCNWVAVPFIFTSSLVVAPALHGGIAPAAGTAICMSAS